MIPPPPKTSPSLVLDCEDGCALVPTGGCVVTGHLDVGVKADRVTIIEEVRATEVGQGNGNTLLLLSSWTDFDLVVSEAFVGIHGEHRFTCTLPRGGFNDHKGLVSTEDLLHLRSDLFSVVFGNVVE